MRDFMGTSWKEDIWLDYTWKPLSWIYATLTEMMGRFRGRFRGRGFP